MSPAACWIMIKIVCKITQNRLTFTEYTNHCLTAAGTAFDWNTQITMEYTLHARDRYDNLAIIQNNHTYFINKHLFTFN